MKAKVEFNEERCKGCNLCVTACPLKIVSLSDRINKKGYQIAQVEDMEKCIGCQSCAIICPDCVITVYKEERKK